MGNRMNAKTMHEMERKRRIKEISSRKRALFHSAASVPLFMADRITARKLIKIREERKRQRRLAQGLELIGSNPSGMLAGQGFDVPIFQRPGTIIGGGRVDAAGRHHADVPIIIGVDLATSSGVGGLTATEIVSRPIDPSMPAGEIVVVRNLERYRK